MNPDERQRQKNAHKTKSSKYPEKPNQGCIKEKINPGQRGRERQENVNNLEE